MQGLQVCAERSAAGQLPLVMGPPPALRVGAARRVEQPDSGGHDMTIGEGTAAALVGVGVRGVESEKSQDYRDWAAEERGERPVGARALLL